MPRAGRRILWVALAGALARLAVVGWLETWSRVEVFEYEEIARNLVAGKGFGLRHLGSWTRTFGSPPYCFLTAAAYGLGAGSPLAMLVVQAALSAGTAWAAGRLATQFFEQQPGANPGVMAAALVAAHPPTFYVDTHKLHPLGLDALLAILGFLALTKARDQWPRWRWLGLGALHGLALLERATYVGLLPLALSEIARLRGNRWPRIAIYATGCALPLAPWLIRSVLLFGSPVLATSDAEVLWRGNNPAASGGAGARDRPGVPVLRAAPPEFQARIARAPEWERRRLFQEDAWRFIRENPGGAAALYCRKLTSFMWVGPGAGSLYPAWFRPAYMAYYAMVVLAAAAGLARGLRDRSSRHARLGIVAFVFSVGFLQALFYVEQRHRWAVEPFLLVLAAGGLVPLLSRRPRLPTPGAGSDAPSGTASEVGRHLIRPGDRL